MEIPEEFLHYIWKYRLFEKGQLFTEEGELIEILNPGGHNRHAGPDFENAQVCIGETLWAGNVEIHIQSSEWERHGHQFDLSYDNVILHVVHVHDKEVFRSDGSKIPVLCLQGLIHSTLFLNYRGLMENINWIPCEKHFSTLDPDVLRTWLSRVMVERLESKVGEVVELVNEVKGSWNDAFYIKLASNFGFKINSLPFQMLARSLPIAVLLKYKDRPVQIEALFFGQAGLLGKGLRGNYPVTLSKEYRFLQQKHSLIPIEVYLWKYLRLRPRNFPPLRIAQFSALVLKSNHLFSSVLEKETVSGVKALFKNLPVNKYWRSHYRFDKSASIISTQMGENSLDNVVINTICTFLFAYGKATGQNDFIDRGVYFLEETAAETNRIIRCFIKYGFKPDNAFFSQGLLQLKKSYCDQKKCLSCGVGRQLMNH